jgi:colicin import membrane protein
MGGAGLAAAGAGAAGAGAAAYYAKVRREARLADEARAKLKAEAQRGILKDRAQAGVDEDRDARARAQNEADRAARTQAQAEAEAKSRATQERIDSELRNNRTVRNDINERAAVLNKDMWAAGPTVTSETPTKKRAPIKAEAPTDMDDFNRMLRESKVGRANTSGPTATASRASADTQTREDAKAARARARLESSGTALPVPTTTTTAAPTENAARLNAQKEAALKAADAQLAATLNSKEMADSAWKQPGETDAQAAARKAKAAEVKNAAIEAHKKQVTSIKAGKIGAAVTLGLTGLGLGSAANAATNMTAGERERLGKDVLEGLITPLGLTPGMAGEGSDLYPSKPLSSAERKKNIETFLANASPADRKKYEEAVARQNPGLLDKIKRPSAANQRAAGGQIKAKKMASGGMTSTVSSASKRGDGIASKGKTRCKLY